MPYLTNLATIARRTGFPVVEQPGWKTRGHGPMSTVRSVICHHDAARQSPSTFNTVIQNGRADLPGPLAHFALRRDGTIHVVAAGMAYHAGAVTDSSIYGNSHSIGIEAGNDGVGEPWPDVQLRAYRALCAELCKAFGLPASRVKGHKEICYPKGRKIDPRGIDMSAFRRGVDSLMKSGGGSSTPPTLESEEMQMDLVQGRHSRYVPVPKGAKRVVVACPRDKMSVRIQWHGSGYPSTRGQFPDPDLDNRDAKFVAKDSVHTDIHAMRPWYVNIPNGARGFRVNWTYTPRGDRDSYVAFLGFES